MVTLELVDNSNVFYISCYGVVHHNRTERQHSRVATNDTIFRIVEKHSVDSIPVVVEVEKPVRYRSGYDRFTLWAFWLMVVAALVALALWLTNKRYHWWNVVRTALKLL